MKIYTCKDLEGISANWRGWRINKGRLAAPNGWSLTPEQILIGNALIEIGAERDRVNMSKIIRTARLLKELPKNRRGS